jgi:exopolysaccharide production protein ExoZ
VEATGPRLKYYAARISYVSAQLFELPGASKRLSAMEGLRGLAILLVFCSHYVALIVPVLAPKAGATRMAATLGEFGAGGVDLFFLLSGFLIYRTALRGAGRRYFSFLARRVERIYPTFLVVLTAYYALSVIGLMDFRGPKGFAGVSYVVANAIFLPGIFDIRATISAAWSLSYEWVFYLSIPLLVLALAVNRWPRTVRISIFAFLAIGYVAFVVAFPKVFPFFVYWDSTRIRLIMFLCGMCVFEILQDESSVRGSGRQRLIALAIIPFAVATFWLDWLRAVTGHDATYATWLQLGALRSATLFGTCAAIGLCSLSSDGILARLFRVRPLRYLGNMSYSFYLTHALALHLLIAPLGGLHLQQYGLFGAAAFVPVALMICLVFSAIVFARIEKPLSLPDASPLAAATAP